MAVSPLQGFRLPLDCAASFVAERLLAKGGYGAVLLAEQKELRRGVVVKLLDGHALADDEQRARFVNEARIAALLNHPHIVRVIDHGTGDLPWIAYELVPGGTLRRLMAGPMEPAGAVEVAWQVAAALEAAHAAGILHRDVKPENVLRADDDTWKLTDFGIARWAESGIKTADGMMLGTLQYLAPETIRGDPTDGRSDLYALGVMLFEMLVGRVPFDAEQPTRVLERHLREVAPSVRKLVPGVPEALDTLVARALAKAPADRFANAAAMKGALAEVRESLRTGVAARPASGANGAGARWSGRLGRAAVLGALGLAGLALVGKPPVRTAGPATASAVARVPSPWSDAVRAQARDLRDALSRPPHAADAMKQKVSDPAVAERMDRLAALLCEPVPLRELVDVSGMEFAMSVRFWEEREPFICAVRALHAGVDGSDPTNDDPMDPGDRELVRLRAHLAALPDGPGRPAGWRRALQERALGELAECRRAYRLTLTVRAAVEIVSGMVERIVETARAADLIGTRSLPDEQEDLAEAESGRPPGWPAPFLRALIASHLGRQRVAGAEYRESFALLAAALKAGTVDPGSHGVVAVAGLLNHFHTATPSRPEPQYGLAVAAARELVASRPELAGLMKTIESLEAPLKAR